MALEVLEEQQEIWRVQTDTYTRELERYGFENIDATEALFYHDSQAAVGFLQQTWEINDAFEQLQWLWCLKSVDGLLDVFEMDLY